VLVQTTAITHIQCAPGNNDIGRACQSTAPMTTGAALDIVIGARLERGALDDTDRDLLTWTAQRLDPRVLDSRIDQALLEKEASSQ